MPAVATAWRRRLPGRLPAARAALLVAGERHAFALTGGWAGVAAIVGGDPRVTLAAPEDRDSGPFAALDRLPALAPDSDPGVIVGGGWFGALGYGLAAAVERTVAVPPRALRLPDAPLGYHDHVLVCDRKGSWWFEALATPGRDAALHARCAELAGRLAAAPRPRPVAFIDVRLRPPGAAGHRAAVASCRERIAAGELFQANLCLHLDATLAGRPADLAVAAAEALTPAHGALVQGPWGALVSASPELFLRRTGRTVRSAPIKGTAPAGADAGLATSAKDRAENVMIVDLVRNDLGRVCDFGSVGVDALAEPRPGAGVTHLVSEVSGRLRDGIGDADLLLASFPPGSVTGAPKVQALKVISELEGAARGAYTGAIGYASPTAGLELSVAIRTFELVGDRVQLGVGGGITAGSDPDAELEECLVKARPLLALGGAGEAVDRAAAAPGTARCPRGAPAPAALADGRERPDPRGGLFETLLVCDGVPQRLGAHLQRLTASAAACGSSPPPADLAERLGTAAVRVGEGRLRVDLAPDGRATCVTGPLPGGAPVWLVPWLLPGGLGAHKWADRRLLTALTEAAGGAVPLLVDGDGAVLEAAWASIWVQEGDRLITPPADGRLLPGVTRAALLIEDARCEEASLTLDRVRAADGLWVSSALRGLRSAALRG